MDKQEIYNYLTEKGIWHHIVEHEAVYNMSEASGIENPYPGYDAKNLFIRDDKKQHYYLITVRGDQRVDLKAFRQQHQTRPLCFASAEDLMSIMSLIPGAVTPFGLLNDEQRRVSLFLDKHFLQDEALIGVHPNDNTATVWLHTKDLIELITQHGNPVHVL